MSFSFRDRGRPRLSDRIRGKSGDELFNELRKEFDKDRKVFFDSPSGTSPTPTSNWGSSTGSSFPRAGHLFDDPLMRGHTDIRSHLEDLAHRHPEFADHLRYPAWSNDNRSNTWGRKRQHDNSGEPSQTEPQPTQQEEASQPAEETDNPLKGRTKDNLRNTVPDMGQKQQQETEEKESRGQRSWSAPPDNRTQQEKPRFVSKIEIHPVNPDAPQTHPQGDATKPPMAPPKPQPQAQPQPQSQQKPQHKQSTVRHIPIFVEGRDEPVLPKNIDIEPEFVQQPPPQQHFSQPPPQQQFSRAPQPQFSSTQHTYHPQQTPQQQTHHEQHPSKSQTPPAQQQQPKPEPQVNTRDPLYKVGLVQKEVDELMPRVENFNGTSRTDKEYMILDELLTRELIKLDDIETEGKEEVRAARKNAIKTIQRCISVLENKVPLPSNENKEEEPMEVEQQTAEAANELPKEENTEMKEQQTEEKKIEEQETTKNQEQETSPSASNEEKKEEKKEQVSSETSSNEPSQNTTA